MAEHDIGLVVVLAAGRLAVVLPRQSALQRFGIGAIACDLPAAQNGWGKETAMIEKSQVELAKTMWDQARAAALQAHDAWDMVMKAQKNLMDSMRGAGPAFSMAADQYDKLMDFHSKQYKAALDFMDKISADYQQVLTKPKK